MKDWEGRVRVLEAENEQLRNRVAALEDALGLTQEFAPSGALRLTASEAQMLGMLLARGYVKRESFFAALYQTRPDADDPPDINIIDVWICKLRAKLKHLGHGTIETRFGEGYFIPASDKPALRAIAEGRAA